MTTIQERLMRIKNEITELKCDLLVDSIKSGDEDKWINTIEEIDNARDYVWNAIRTAELEG